MEGLINEGKELLQEDMDENALDAGLIGAAQKVEHYEIAAYGTARTHADMMGHDKIARLLQQTLDEEGETDKKLTAIAERVINPEAMHAA
jgi:ferritin-like metal-binding protein YciE